MLSACGRVLTADNNGGAAMRRAMGETYKMKKWLTFFALSFAFAAAGCNGTESDDSEQCAADACKDSGTLYRCDNGTRTEVKCNAGEVCADNACKPQSDTGDACAADACKDSGTLYRCDNGTRTEVKCNAGEVCADNACKPQSDTGDACAADACKDSGTLYRCDNGTRTEVKCNAGEVCADNACKPQSDTGDACAADACKDSGTLYRCDNGTRTEVKCNAGEVCADNACKSQSDTGGECTRSACDASDASTVKECQNGKYVPKLCGDGEICYGGGCMRSFVIGEPCSDADGYGKCTADGNNAIVCHKSHITKYTCADPCEDGEDGFANCPKKSTKPQEEKECNDSDVMPTCADDKSSVYLCQKGKYTTWNCADNSCAVDSKGAITCDRVPEAGALTEGGTYGDPCDGKRYQEKCIDKYFALICDTDYIVRIKPAGDCAIDPANPLKVTYTKAAACDATIYEDSKDNILPFCINGGKAIGYCMYNDPDDLSSGEYRAAQCADCTSQERANACMLE